MDALAEMVREAGGWGLAVFALGGSALVLAIVAAALAWGFRVRASVSLTLAVAASALVLVTALIALVGVVAGFARVSEMLGFLNGEEAQRMEIYGPRVAWAPGRLAALLLAPAAVFTAAAWIRGVIAFRGERVHLHEAAPALPADR